METSVLCVKYQGKPLGWLAIMKILHKTPSNEVAQLTAGRINQLERYRLKIRMIYMQLMISELNDEKILTFSSILMNGSVNRLLTTNNIRMIPVGVFNGRRSQCNGTPHGADGI